MRAEPLAERGHPLVVEIGAADVEEASRGVLNRLDHRGVAVSGGADRDARHEVEEAVAVHVLDHGPSAPRDDERILLDVAGGRPGFVARDDGVGLRARAGEPQSWDSRARGPSVTGVRMKRLHRRILASIPSITVRLCSRRNCAT